MVGRAVLPTDNDGIGLFLKKHTGTYDKKGSKLDSIEYVGNVPRAITWVVDHLETWLRSLPIANGLKKTLC